MSSYSITSPIFLLYIECEPDVHSYTKFLKFPVVSKRRPLSSTFKTKRLTVAPLQIPLHSFFYVSYKSMLLSFFKTAELAAAIYRQFSRFVIVFLIGSIEAILEQKNSNHGVVSAEMRVNPRQCGLTSRQQLNSALQQPHCKENTIFIYIPFLGIARPQPQFQHSCVCERFI